MSIEDITRKILVEQLGVAEEEVTPTALLWDDLGADSLDTVELMMAFEEDFGIEIPDEAVNRVRTVGDIMRYLKRHVPASPVVSPTPPSDYDTFKQAHPELLRQAEDDVAWGELSISDLDRLSIRTGCETETNRRAELELRRRGYMFDATNARWVVSPTPHPEALCAKCGRPEWDGHMFGFRDHGFSPTPPPPHVCGETGYVSWIDPPCPGCEYWRETCAACGQVRGLHGNGSNLKNCPRFVSPTPQGAQL